MIHSIAKHVRFIYVLLASMAMLPMLSCATQKRLDASVNGVHYVDHEGNTFATRDYPLKYNEIWLSKKSGNYTLTVKQPVNSTGVVILSSEDEIYLPRLVGNGRFALYSNSDDMLVLQLISTGGRKKIITLQEQLREIEVAKPGKQVTLTYQNGKKQIVNLAKHMFNFEQDVEVEEPSSMSRPQIPAHHVVTPR